MTVSALLIGATERAALARLRMLATENPVDMTARVESIKTVDGLAAHMKQMNAQTVAIPMAFLVTFSIETEHPAGTCRHMSLSSTRHERVPTQAAVWMIARELGFVGSAQFEGCMVYLEPYRPGEKRQPIINVVQPVHIIEATGRRQ